MSNIQSELARIQKELRAPKNQYNSFGKYKYRSCEDILEGLKSVLGPCSVVVTDEIVMIGDRVYVKATAELQLGQGDKVEVIPCNGWAREPQSKKGMDESQITGATSSYARKYALNGLFAIDDNQDADTQAPPTQEPTRDEYQPRAEAAIAAHTEILANNAELSKWVNETMAVGGYKAVVDYFNQQGK